MKHYTSSRFWVCFNALPVEVQKLARRNYAVLKRDPTHPSLQFKLVADGRYRSVRVGLHYRALGIQCLTAFNGFGSVHMGNMTS